MIPTFCNDTVTVLRAPWVSERGSKVRDWSQAVSHNESGCSFQIGATSSDTGEPREQEQAEAVLYANPGADFEAGDRVEFAGAVWVVDGIPYGRTSPFGGIDYVRVSLRRWQG